MESLSSVGTIVRIAQDIAGAVATVSRNKSRCRKLAKRVQGIGDLLRELHVSEAEGAGTTDAATSSLLGRLEDALHRALQLVQSCRDSSCPGSLLAGGRRADQFDEVDGEIDRCLLDLGVANRILLEKVLRHQHQNAVRCCDLACSTETVTLRVGMPCDDSTDHIKRCIHKMQGVMDVAAAASTNDQFRVTVRSGAVDIPSLLEQVKEKLNRNVELVTPAARKDTGGGRWDDVKKYDGKVDNNKGAAEDGGDKQKHCRYAIGGDEIKKEKAAANNTGMNHAPTSPYAYLPFAVALVPIATDGSNYQAPSLPYSFLPYTQDPPRNAQPYQHRVPSPAKKYDGGGDRKDTGVKDDGAKDDDRKTEKVATDRGSDKKEPKPTGGGETKGNDKTAVAAGTCNQGRTQSISSGGLGPHSILLIMYTSWDLIHMAPSPQLSRPPVAQCGSWQDGRPTMPSQLRVAACPHSILVLGPPLPVTSRSACRCAR